MADVQGRKGTVLAWDPLTAHNTVEVDGNLFEDLPILNTTEAAILQPGDVVGILAFGQAASSWWIVGRITVPGTPPAVSALTALGIRAANVSAVEGTTSSSYTDLTTVGPTLTDIPIGRSGRCLVFLSAYLQESSAPPARGGAMSFAVTGATTLPASFERELSIGHTDDGVIASGFSSNNLMIKSTAVIPVSGLQMGLNTFTAKYRQLGNVGVTVEFYNRTIIVFPL